MIEKIVVSRKSDPAVAALQTAVKLGWETGGWSRADEGDFMDAFGLSGMDLHSQTSAEEQCLAECQGALFFITGQEDGASLQLEKIKRCASRLKTPFLVVQFGQRSAFEASRSIAEWIEDKRIRVLYVDGEPCGFQLAFSCKPVGDVLETAYFLTMASPKDASPHAPPRQESKKILPSSNPPETLEMALVHLEKTMTLRDKAAVANLVPEELAALGSTIGAYINRQFDLFSAGSALVSDCRRKSGEDDLAPEDAAAFIIRHLWERLRATCRIRVVK